MEDVDDVVRGNAILEQVHPENRDLFREIFMDDDSDEEFLGLNVDELENDEETVDFEEIWVNGNMDVRHLQFRAEKKINMEIPKNAEIIDFFKLYDTDEFIEDILKQETNKYAQNFLHSAHQDFLHSAQRRNLKPQSRFHIWTNVTTDEMKRFIAMIIGMGLVQHQDIQDYLNRDEVLETPFFRETMSRNRFLLIMSLFHLNNNENQIPQGQDGYDSSF